MMRNGLLALICSLSMTFVAAPVLAQSSPSGTALPKPSEIERVVTPRSQQFTLRSHKGREYRIQVAEPKSGPPAAGYPVIYALDGNAVFATFAETVRVQRLAPILIVAIGYASDNPFDPTRVYDFTPPTRTEGHDTDPTEKTGGQNEFLAFIQDELKSVIEKKFKVNRDRQTLFGHSLGGLFVLHALYTRPEAFQTYACGAPSIWWNDQSILAEEREFVKRNGAKVDLFLFVGERDARHMVHDATRASERLTPLGAYGMRVYFQVFDQEDHVSVLPAAISRTCRIAGNRVH